MQLNTQILIVGAGCNSSNASKWLDPVQAACDRFKIDTPEAFAAFLANVGVESAGFSVLVENLNYSATALARTWKSRYSVDPTAAVKVPNAKAIALAGKPEAIANDVYSNRMGNGAPETGDGWRNRGQGPIQITGHDNLVACMMAIELDVVAHPELLQAPEAGALSAAWFFVDRANCLPYCDKGNFDGTVKAINGQLPCEANHGELRKKRYTDVLALLKK